MGQIKYRTVKQKEIAQAPRAYKLIRRLAEIERKIPRIMLWAALLSFLPIIIDPNYILAGLFLSLLLGPLIYIFIRLIRIGTTALFFMKITTVQLLTLTLGSACGMYPLFLLPYPWVTLPFVTLASFYLLALLFVALQDPLQGHSTIEAQQANIRKWRESRMARKKYEEDRQKEKSSP